MRLGGGSWPLTAGAFAAAAAMLTTTGCKPYRIEYRTRPAFYRSAATEPLPDRVEMPDGTVIIYRDQQPTVTGTADVLSLTLEDDAGERGDGSEAEPFQIREEKPDGTVILRNYQPAHVIANTMSCLRAEEYQLMWDQLVADRTKRAYAARGMGFDEFADFMQRHREPLMETLNYMRFSLLGQDVVVETLGVDSLRVRFSPQVAEQFTFQTVEMVREMDGMKLAVIR